MITLKGVIPLIRSWTITSTLDFAYDTCIVRISPKLLTGYDPIDKTTSDVEYCNDGAPSLRKRTVLCLILIEYWMNIYRGVLYPKISGYIPRTSWKIQIKTLINNNASLYDRKNPHPSRRSFTRVKTGWGSGVGVVMKFGKIRLPRKYLHFRPNAPVGVSWLWDQISVMTVSTYKNVRGCVWYETLRISLPLTNSRLRLRRSVNSC